jgi:serine/threonine protein kinase
VLAHGGARCPSKATAVRFGPVWLAQLKAESGRVWVVDESKEVAPQRRAKAFHGWQEGRENERVFVQRVAGGDLFDDDREHLRRAMRIARLPKIGSCPFVLRAIDVAEPWDSFFFFELAEGSLQELGHRGLTPSEAASLRTTIGEALAATHAAGYVHCDVKPDNILRVDDVWKLADFGGAVPIGEPVDVLPRDKQFVQPGITFGAHASTAIDRFALTAVLEWLEA